ncbi:MAG: hypothetical protein H8E66_26435 [Planctomycetes bacterium]|nr:hypothetical protein [Planctomycetota bacterium]
MTLGRLNIWVASSLLCCLGCGGSDEPQRHALRGSVAVKGSPVAKGTISFLPSQGVSGAPASTSVEDGEYRFSNENGPFAGLHRVIIGIDEPLEDVNGAMSPAAPTGASSGIKVAPPPERPQGARRGRPATTPLKTQWEVQYTIEDDGENRKDFDLSG